MLFLEGVYVERPDGSLRFRGVKALTSAELTRLAALAPKTLALLAGWALPRPRVNLTRFHGIFRPNSRYRGRVTKAKRGRGSQCATTGDAEAPTPAERRGAMSCTQRA